jgi:hypothetical protein
MIRQHWESLFGRKDLAIGSVRIEMGNKNFRAKCLRGGFGCDTDRPEAMGIHASDHDSDCGKGCWYPDPEPSAAQPHRRSSRAFN